jgi:hypothetical protein
VNASESIDAARAEAVESLVGHHSIVGVGQSEDALVFFVSNLSAAQDEICRWSALRDVPIEVQVVGGFRPAAS